MKFDIKKSVVNLKSKLDSYLLGKPHRSFRKTSRRDYDRQFELPGYISFTHTCASVLKKNHRLFLALVLVYAFVTILLVGMASQDTYSTLVDTLNSTSGDALDNFWGRVGGAGLLFVASISGGVFQPLGEAQQVYVTIITVITSMVAVWLLRNVVAGRKVSLRSGLYNACAPAVPVSMIIMLVVIQLLPIGIAIVGYNAADTTGLLRGGIEAMLFWMVAGLLTTLSLYFVIGSIFALVIVTLPGMYPYQAVKMASQMILGRRLKIAFRLTWMILFASLVWLLVMVPIIILDMWLKDLLPGLEWLPIVPAMLLLMTGLTVVWVNTYVYMLYRKLVDNETKSV